VENQYRSELAIGLGLLLIVSIILVQPIPSNADIADMASLTVNGDMVYCSNLTMPEADANIRITNTESEGINVKVYCQFQVISNVTDIAYLAFVYPQQWRLGITSSIEIGFDIRINKMSTDYTIVTSKEMIDLGLVTEPEDNETTWTKDLDFVLFSCNMTEFEPYSVVVITNTWGLSSEYYVEFSYVIASAKTFGSSTRQAVRMHLVEDKKLISYSFIPANYLTQSTNETGTTAIWDMTIDNEFNFSQVYFTGYVGKFERNFGFPFYLLHHFELIIGGIAGIIVVVIGVLVVWVRGSSKHPQ